MTTAATWHRQLGDGVPVATRGGIQAVAEQPLTMFIAQSVYFIFLMMIFIGQQPFASRNQEELVALAAVSDGSDVFKQAFFVGFAFLLSVIAFARKYPSQYRFTYWPLAIMLVWFLITCTWGVNPFVSFKRAMQQVIVIYITFLSLTLMGGERLYQTLRAALIAALLICWISLPLTPNAYHPATESDKALIGAWRGFFFHKNIAGAVMAMTFVTCAHAFATTRKWYFALFSIMAFVFVIGTKSKTSLALCFGILAASGIYRALSGSPAKRAVLLLFIGFGMVAFLGLYVAYEPYVDHLFTDPKAFTGRVSIWRVPLGYIRDHPYLGAGFGGFWQVGDISPSIGYMNEKFQMLTAHSHNGYLEIWVTTGPLGLALLILSFVLLPAWWFLTGATDGNRTLMATAFAIWSFVLYQNLLETSFFDKDRQVWVIFLSAIAIAHAAYKQRAPERWHRQPSADLLRPAHAKGEAS